MNLLLDTHTLIWFADSDPNLSAHALSFIADPANNLFLSMASVWEMAIKCGIGKLTLSPNYKEYLSKAISGYDISILGITCADCVSYSTLPFPNPKHRDPYDRMIVIHALRYALVLLSIDDKLDGFGVNRLW
ncbi:MAG: type II toxin-antitoxin system VapC family toxin [Bacteroidales bacterium]|nr:type II toxin-antitoxin system VapC family toxin [Bacteroidales bacterium]